MKIIIFSDSHYKVENMMTAIKYFEDEIYGIIHLGDCVEDAEYIEINFKDKKVFFVNGNNDMYCKKKEALLTLNGHKIYICHGHLLNVYNGVSSLYHRASELDANVALYGHTHKMFCCRQNGMLILNPGSISYPRGTNLCTFATIDIKSEITYNFFYVNNDKINEI